MGGRFTGLADVNGFCFSILKTADASPRIIDCILQNYPVSRRVKAGKTALKAACQTYPPR